MLGEETCLLQDSEWFFRGSWYVYITAHKQMGYELNCITEECSCLTSGGKIAPRGVLKQTIVRRPHLFKVKHHKRSQSTAGCASQSEFPKSSQMFLCKHKSCNNTRTWIFFLRMQEQIF